MAFRAVRHGIAVDMGQNREFVFHVLSPEKRTENITYNIQVSALLNHQPIHGLITREHDIYENQDMENLSITTPCYKSQHICTLQDIDKPSVTGMVDLFEGAA